MARTFHSDSRWYSLFTATELAKLCGVPQGRWPSYVAKELIDNAIAALEDHAVSNPMLWITVTREKLIVQDNGPGVPDTVLDRMLQFSSFGGSNRHARLPTRGAQGNAFGTIVGIVNAWAPGRSMIIGRPLAGTVAIDVTVDPVRQEVHVDKRPVEPRVPRSSFEVPWPELPWKKGGSDLDEVIQLVMTMVRLNPHVTFFVKTDGGSRPYPMSADAEPVMSTHPLAGAATWFTPAEFHGRLAADVRARPETSLLGWASEFHMAVLARLKTTPGGTMGNIGELTDGATEQEFAQFAEQTRKWVLACTDSRAADPKQLNTIGQARLASLLVDEFGADGDARLEYHVERGTFSNGVGDVPFLVEACLVQMPEGTREAPEPMFAMNRTLLYGSPKFRKLTWREKVRGDWHTTSGDLSALTSAYAIGGGKTPCAVVVHVSCPAPSYVSYGKSEMDTTWLQEPISQAMERVTLHVRKQRAGEARRVIRKDETDGTIRDTLWGIIPEVWESDTEGGKLPIMLRQLYYGVRKVWHLHHSKELQYNTYCAYLDEYEVKIAGKSICLRDPRGTLIEPHSGRELRLGTDAVSKYEPKKWEGHTIIFVEKEQFAHLFKAYGLTKRYDAIVIGSKGFAVESCREVLQKYKRLLGDVVKIVAVHDSDPAGYQIGYDLATNLPRFGENVDVQVYDIGLRMSEAQEMSLQDEPFEISKPQWSMIRNMRSMLVKDPDGLRRPLLDEAAWDQFMPRQFRTLEYPGHFGKIHGRRVEINALKPRDLVEWLEKHLDRIGAKKVRPPDAVVDDHLLNARENHVKNQLGSVFFELLGDDLVHEIMAEVGVPAHDLDRVLAMKPEQHWSYLVERAAKSGTDVETVARRKVLERLGRS